MANDPVRLAPLPPDPPGVQRTTIDSRPRVSRKLKLLCLSCQQVGVYDVGEVMLDPDADSDEGDGLAPTPFSFTNYFHCKSCGSAGPWSVADYFKLLSLTLRARIARADGPVVCGKMHLFDGTWIQTPAEGEKYLLGLIERDPRNAFLHTRLGNLFRGCGLKDRAAEKYRNALALNANDLEARYHSFQFAIDAQNIPETVTHASQLVRALLRGAKTSSDELTRGLAREFVHTLLRAPDEFCAEFWNGPDLGKEPPQRTFIRTLFELDGDEGDIVDEATERLLAGEPEPALELVVDPVVRSRDSSDDDDSEETDDGRDLDLVPSLRALVKSEGLNQKRLNVCVEMDQNGRIRVVDRHTIRVTDGAKVVAWPVPSVRELWRGNQAAPADMVRYPKEYHRHFYFVERHVVRLCEAQVSQNPHGEPTDQEMESIYSALRRRPDGRSLGPTHDFLWQVSALLLGTRALSQAQFEATVGQLERSVRGWALRPVSRNYVQFLRGPH